MAESLGQLHDIRKDELRSDVRDYAANLEVQIKDEIQRSGFADIESYLQNAEASEAGKLANLVRALYDVRQSGEIPFEEENFLSEYDAFIVQLEFYSNRNNFNDTKDWLKGRLMHITLIPPGVFINNPRYLEKLFNRIKDVSDHYTAQQLGGLVTSQLFIRSSEELAKNERGLLVQEMDLSAMSDNELNYLGADLDGGKLILHGKAGKYMGWNMKDGEIVSGIAGDFCGGGMRGGIIRVGNAGNHLGYASSRGEIIVDHGYVNLGMNCHAQVYAGGKKVK